MTDATQGAPLPAAPPPALDLSAYTEVVILKTGEVEGHPYCRGSRHTVDAVTLKALRDLGLIAPPAAAAHDTAKAAPATA